MKFGSLSMSDKILYCGSCGKLIHPEQAEREDYESLGGEPICIACLEKSDPARKQKLDEVRSTRLRLRAIRREEVAMAMPPQQVYPLPTGAPSAPIPDNTEIREIRKELADELSSAHKAATSAPAAKKPSEKALKPVTPSAPVPAAPKPEPALEVLSPGEAARMLSMPPEPADPNAQARRRTRMALWALMAASCMSLLLLLAWPNNPVNEPAAVPPTPPAQPIPPQQIAPPPITPGKPIDPALSEIETIAALANEDPTPERLQRTIERLKAAGQSSEAARNAAAEIIARLETDLDAYARETTRAGVQAATDLAAEERFTDAQARLEALKNALPSSPWARKAGAERVAAARDALQRQRDARLDELSRRIQALAASGKQADAVAAAQELARHPEPDFRNAGEALARRFVEDKQAKDDLQKQREEAALIAWPKFFKDFDAALGTGDFAKVAEICRTPADSPLLNGGIENPALVVAGFAHEADAVAALFDAVLDAAQFRAQENLKLSLGADRERWRLVGRDASNLVLKPENGNAERKISVERLEPQAIAVLLDLDKPGARAKFGPALWALAAARGQLGESNFRDNFQQLNQPLPAHWSARFAIESRLALRQRVAQEFEALRKTVALADAEAVRAALARVRPLLPVGERFLSPADRELLAQAEKLGGSGHVKSFVFQNRNAPTPDYLGVHAEQISKFYKDSKKTDPGTQNGVKLGAYPDLQRILVRFDGLDAQLKHGRVLKATLELFQLDNFKGATSAGANIGVFRLKRAWLPGAGTWLDADLKKKVIWQQEGATGVEDSVDKADAQLLLDAQTGAWRSFDITLYVREVLDGKAANHGLLLRVTKDEPKYAPRFYPNSDLDDKKDPALRPRLVVEFEAAE